MGGWSGVIVVMIVVVDQRGRCSVDGSVDGSARGLLSFFVRCFLALMVVISAISYLCCVGCCFFFFLVGACCCWLFIIC